jgi:hypothetical protein
MTIPIETSYKIFHTPISRMLKSDPLAHFLWKKNITPVRFGLLAFAYGLFYGLVLPAIFGILPQALADWPTLVIVVVIAPILLGYYAWEPFTIQALFDGVSARVKKASYKEEQISRLTRPLGLRAWTIVAVVLGLFQCATFIYNILSKPVFWQSQNWVMIAALMPVRFLSFYAMVFIIVRQLGTILGVNRFMEIFRVEVAPLHPDKAGGLRCLSYYVLTTAVMLGALGLIFGMRIFRYQLGLESFSFESSFELALYLLMLPLFLLTPLWRAHRLMSVEREKILVEVASRFEQHYNNSISELRDGVTAQAHVDEISALQKLYEIAEKAPTWPMNTETISQFGAVVILPVIMPLILEFLGNFLQFMLQFGK